MGRADEREPESLAEVLASIRALVSAEANARVGGEAAGDSVLALTSDMRADRRPGNELAEGIEQQVPGAPILDEESLRRVVNAIVREELQGELGERISRNLRKLIRREIAQMLDQQRKD